MISVNGKLMVLSMIKEPMSSTTDKNRSSGP